MTEEEEFEFRARAEAEAAAEPPPPAEPEEGIFSRGAKWVGRQASRLPAAIRGGVQALQGGDPRVASTSRNPLVMAGRGFLEPESVQSSGQMMANAGVSTEPKMQVRTPTVDQQIMARAKGLPAPAADTTYTSPAQEFGTAFDFMAPTGLEFLPIPVLRALNRGGRRMEQAGTQAIQSSLKPSQQLRNAPVPYNSENFLTPRAGAPDGLASAMGKRRTLENIEAFHNRLGDAQDALLENMPEVDVMQAIANASRDVENALRQGGDHALGLSARDANALRQEIEHWAEAAERISPNGLTTGRNARQFRGSLGQEARYNGSAEATNARRVVAATIRERLNEQFAHVSPEFRQLDRQFAETIPLRNSVADALGREGNRYPIGLRSSVVLATGGASIPAEMAKIALIEGTSRFGPQVAVAKMGRALAGGAEAVRPLETLPIPALQAARAMGMPENAIPFRMRNVAKDEKPPQNLPELAAWIRQQRNP